MRASPSLLAKYVQSIKFVGGPHVFHNHPAGPHPCAPDGLVPGSGATSSQSAGLDSHSYISRSQLPKRFRYSAVDDIEIEDVNQGGAEVMMQ